MLSIITVITFLLILTVLVLIHELGHFFVAKKFGIKVEEFGFGLPPRAFGIKKGETIYSINWLPIGGFVKLQGEDEKVVGKKSFSSRLPWQRGAVVIAGVLMNFLLTVVIFSFFYTQGVKTQESLGAVRIESVNTGSPAQQAGIQSQDLIVSIDGVNIIKNEELQKKTREKLGEKLKLTIKRNEQTLILEVVPRVDSPTNEGPMGVVITDMKIVEKKYPIYQAPLVATVDALNLSWMIVAGLGTILWQLISQGAVPQGVAGPVGIAQATGQFVAVGPLAVLSFAALLSLNLAVLNIMPIPALDGGRLFFILIEGIFRKKVNPHFERYTHSIGMVILLALLALITFHDLSRIFSGQSILPTP